MGTKSSPEGTAENIPGRQSWASYLGVDESARESTVLMIQQGRLQHAAQGRLWELIPAPKGRLKIAQDASPG
jgi:hypothetical protein